MGQPTGLAQRSIWAREVNEKLAHRTARRPRADLSFDALCECNARDCVERVPLTYATYEAIRPDGTLFIVRATITPLTREKRSYALTATNSFDPSAKRLGQP